MDLTFAIRGQFPAGDDMQVRLEELFVQARLAQKLGFKTIAKSQHYSSAPFQEIQQFPFLTRVAAEVPGMQLLTGITLLSLHKPLDMAEQLAALDLISGGKLIFGSGLGYREVEFKAFGSTQSERVTRFVENIEAIKRLWTEDTVTMKGSHFELIEASCSLKPVQDPHPRMWIGANADMAIKRAANIADAWFIPPHNRTDTIMRQMDVYKRALEEAGKGFPKDLPIAREMFIAESREEAMRLARPYLEVKYKAYHEWGQGKAMPAGDNDLGQDYDELVRDRFLFGGVEEVAEQLIDFARVIGTTDLFCPIQWPGMPQSHVLDQMHMLTERVMPLVKQGLDKRLNI
jgi:alkanesulfonate monooxygenase SsuD/methylene tetrahydromethanopterin reductase-like flavin-dependent oxidoreductase (luciferase family)